MHYEHKAPVVVVCPKCGLRTVQEFYGPCKACRAALRTMTPPPADTTHFSPTRRMDGQHAIAVNVCHNPACRRKACVQAREEG